MAGTGAVSISSGSSPHTAIACTRARGVRPSSVHRAALMSRTAAAPSVIWDEFPAVTCHPISGKRAATSSRRKAGVSVPRPSAVLSGRIVSSRRNGPAGVSTGTVSRSNAPESRAAAASRCERAAYSSSASRPSFQRAATSSAATPCDTSPGAYRSATREP